MRLHRYRHRATITCVDPSATAMLDVAFEEAQAGLAEHPGLWREDTGQAP